MHVRAKHVRARLFASKKRKKFVASVVAKDKQSQFETF